MGSTTGSVEYSAFLRVDEYITRSPARNPRIVDTMKVIVTPMATVTPIDRMAAVGVTPVGSVGESV